MLVLLLGMAGWIWWQPSPETRISERVSVPLAVPVMPAAVEAPVVEVAVETAPVQVPSPELPAPRPTGVEPAPLGPARALPAPEQNDGPAETPGPVERLAVAAPEPVAPPEPAVAMQPSAEPEPVPERPSQPTVGEASDETSGAPGDVRESVGSEVATLQAMAGKGDSSTGEALLLNWPDQGYTLQMLGARQAETARDFIASQVDPGAFHYFSTLYKGKPWHVVVHGRYDSRRAAVEAVAALPAELRQLKPWARSIQSVKADIRKKSR
ncbi:SPOR domain-containing protein [Marinobacterium aestuariivivens]|uniref:SPOR domain-containing protein n=1 Tax=Marinobacterium aestuariivivens TaxID=1698799 RepID=A0ABW1ZYF8_9GAMM